jgi:MFS family permease
LIGAEIRRYSSDRRGLALNVFLGIAGGAFGSLAETLILPILVLSFFVAKLTLSFAVIGLVPAIGVGLWALARVPAHILTGPRRRKLPWAIAAVLVRSGAVALLAVVCFRTPPEFADTVAVQEQLLRAFFVCYVAYSLAAGFASVPVAAVVAKSIPHEARPLFFRQRALWGGVMGLVAGLVVSQLLRGTVPPFPGDYALLFLAATVCQLAAAFFVATIREPIRVAEAGATTSLATVRAMPLALADPNFRRFLVFRTLLSAAGLLDPFLIIFAITRLGASEAAVGGYLIAFVGGRLLATPLWAWLSSRHGDKAVLQVSALLRLVPPLLALLLPYLTATTFYRDRFPSPLLPSWLFGLAFVAIGATVAGQTRGNFGYLAAAAPARLRATYAGLTNGVLAFVAISPVLGGLLIDRRGFSTLLLVTTVIGLLAVFASGALADTFVRARPTAAWRLRRPAAGSPGEATR